MPGGHNRDPRFAPGRLFCALAELAGEDDASGKAGWRFATQAKRKSRPSPISPRLSSRRSVLLSTRGGSVPTA